MLSNRGNMAVSQLDVPWRFAPAGKARYDPVTNPDGPVTFATAENSLMHHHLSEFANQVSIHQ